MFRGDTLKVGMSLVEILVSLGILACLSALSLPMFGRFRDLRENAICSSNLRQMGLAVLAYGNDHDGQLPGPLLFSQYGYWNHYTVISWYLEPYLPIIKNRWKTRGDVMICPANRRLSTRLNNTPTWHINTEVNFEGSSEFIPPFGYPNSYYSGYRNKIEDEAPMRLSDLARIVNSDGLPAQSQTWAIKCADGLEFIAVRAGTSTVRDLPKQMCHTTHRNALFYDFHVGRVDLNNKPN